MKQGWSFQIHSLPRILSATSAVKPLECHDPVTHILAETNTSRLRVTVMALGLYQPQPLIHTSTYIKLLPNSSLRSSLLLLPWFDITPAENLLSELLIPN